MKKRKDVRFDVDEPVTIVPPDSNSSIPGRISNFSGMGLCVRIDRRFSVGTRLEVIWGLSRLTGRVRYCNRTAGGFRIGLELREAIYEPDQPVAAERARRSKNGDSRLKRRPPRKVKHQDFGSFWEPLR